MTTPLRLTPKTTTERREKPEPAADRKIPRRCRFGIHAWGQWRRVEEVKTTMWGSRIFERTTVVFHARTCLGCSRTQERR